MFVGFIGVCPAAAVCAIGWLRTYQLLIARSRQQEMQERASRLIEEERRILELVAQGGSLKQVRDSFTGAIERMAPGSFSLFCCWTKMADVFAQGRAGVYPTSTCALWMGSPLGLIGDAAVQPPSGIRR